MKRIRGSVWISVLCVSVAAGWAYREWSWARYRSRTETVEGFLDRIVKAPGKEDEKRALLELAAWDSRQGGTLSMAAYDHATGKHVDVSQALHRPSTEVLFEVGFDLDRDMRPERFYHVWLKDPAVATLLLME